MSEQGDVRQEEEAPALSGLLAALGFVLGVVIGAAAGLIGVGGGEFRIPALLHVLRLPVKIAAGVNMVVGLCTVALGVVRRWGQQEWTDHDITLAVVMAVASILGAVIGARQASRFSSPFLKVVVCAYLVVVGTWMVVEAVAHAETILLAPTGVAGWILAAGVGFFIAALSGALGVAGGEMRIPALIYLFALPVKEAGTVSLLVSVPTVASGAVAYRRLGHVPNRALLVAVVMGVGSLLGVLAGTSLLPFVDKHTLKGLLGVILLVATVCLTLPGLFKKKGDRPEETRISEEIIP
jgi:uncharacterized membrane protein YfcA